MREDQIRRFRPFDQVEAIKTLCKDIGDGELTIGIDPGQSGAVAFLPHSRRVEPIVLDIPVLKVQVDSNRKGKKVRSVRGYYDHASILGYFDPFISADKVKQVTIALERTNPHPHDTAVTGFSMGVAYGMWGLFFVSFAFRVDEIMPAVWKRRMGLLKQDKDACRMRAMKLFPSIAHYFRCKSDDGRAEALLIAECIRKGHSANG